MDDGSRLPWIIAVLLLFCAAFFAVAETAYATIVTTIVVFFAGEMLPKSIAKKYSEPLALATGPVLRFLMKVFTPLSALLTWIGQSAAKLTPDETPVSFTEDELYDIIEDMTEEGSQDEQQRELNSSALQYRHMKKQNVLSHLKNQ